eukprot:UN07540
MMQEQLVTTSEFGESNYGKRLDYGQPKYRDPIFAILYIIHVIMVIGVGIYLWASQYPNISESNNDTSLKISFNVSGVIVGIVVCMIVGVLFGILWLHIMKKFAEIIIKSMLFFNIGMWLIVSIVGVIANVLALAVIGAIMAAIYGLWTWCIWRRIPFASVLLSISSTIIIKYQGTIFISLAVIIFN